MTFPTGLKRVKVQPKKPPKTPVIKGRDIPSPQGNQGIKNASTKRSHPVQSSKDII
jgi:hypothetical protein